MDMCTSESIKRRAQEHRTDSAHSSLRVVSRKSRATWRYVSDIIGAAGSEGLEGSTATHKLRLVDVIMIAKERANYEQSLKQDRLNMAADELGNMEMYSDENVGKRAQVAKHDSVIAAVLKFWHLVNIMAFNADSRGESSRDDCVTDDEDAEGADDGVVDPTESGAEASTEPGSEGEAAGVPGATATTTAGVADGNAAADIAPAASLASLPDTSDARPETDTPPIAAAKEAPAAPALEPADAAADADRAAEVSRRSRRRWKRRRILVLASTQLVVTKPQFRELYVRMVKALAPHMSQHDMEASFEVRGAAGRGVLLRWLIIVSRIMGGTERLGKGLARARADDIPRVPHLHLPDRGHVV